MPTPRKRRQTTGAAPSSTTHGVDSPQKATPSVSETLAAANVAVAQDGASIAGSPPAHQIDGSYLPITGPITSVHQLTRGKNVSQNSVASFGTMEAYNSYLSKLTVADLHRHALVDARVVPIDDKARLIRRLEANWTAVAAREKQRAGIETVAPRVGFSTEQMEKQEAIRRRMLAGRG